MRKPIPGIGFLRFARELAMSFADLAVLLKTVRRFKPQAIMLQTLLYPCYLALFVSKKVPLIITFWNGDVTWWARSTGMERLCKRQIVSRLSRRAAAITVNSTAAQRACAEYGARPEKVHLLRYPGVDTRSFRQLPKNSFRQELGIQASRVVLCPRGLAPYCNNGTIVAAAKIVAGRYKDVLFLFVSGVGTEQDWNELMKQAAGSGISGNFRRDGQVPWESMPAYYCASDCMISISSNDSLPNCMLEAMACRIPVVMGDIPAIREWVTDDQNGFLVPVNDHQRLASRIIEAFSDSKKTETLSASGLQRVLDDADSVQNVPKIKELVKVTAR
jgi:glycosyltransferase involved in cell wall biosynthesis